MSLPDAGHRIQQSMQHLFDALLNIKIQLNESELGRRELQDVLERQQLIAEKLRQTIEDLQLQLDQESKGRLYLAEELSRAEGI